MGKRKKQFKREEIDLDGLRSKLSRGALTFIADQTDLSIQGVRAQLKGQTKYVREDVITFALKFIEETKNATLESAKLNKSINKA